MVDNGCESGGDGEWDDGDGGVDFSDVEGKAGCEGNLGCDGAIGSALVMVPPVLCNASLTVSSRLWKRPELSVAHASASNASTMLKPYLQLEGAAFCAYP